MKTPKIRRFILRSTERGDARAWDLSGAQLLSLLRVARIGARFATEYDTALAHAMDALAAVAEHADASELPSAFAVDTRNRLTRVADRLEAEIREQPDYSDYPLAEMRADLLTLRDLAETIAKATDV